MTGRGIDQLVDDALGAVQARDEVRALAIVDQIAAAAPDNAEVYWLRATMMVDKDPAEAHADARRATQLDPESPDAHFILACATWKLGDRPLAQESFQRAIKLAGNDPDIRMTYHQFKAAT